MAVGRCDTDGIARCSMLRAIGSHWTPLLGNCSLRLAPVVASATANKTKNTKCTHFDGRFDGHGGVVRRYYT